MESRRNEYVDSGAVPHVPSWKPGERICSLEELYSAADIKLSREVSVSVYFRDLEETLEKAKRRLMDQDIQYAYVFYMRYATVVIKQLPHIPGYNNPEHAKNRERTFKNLKKALSTLERLQPILRQRHEVYKKYLGSLPRPKAEVSTYSKRRGSGLKGQLALAPEPLPERRDSVDSRNGKGKPKIHLSREEDQMRYGYSLTDTLKDLNINQGRKSSQDSSMHGQQSGGTRVEMLISYPTLSPTSPQPPKPLIETPLSPSPQAPPELSARPSAPTSSTYHGSYGYTTPAVIMPEPDTHKPEIPPKPREYYDNDADIDIDDREDVAQSGSKDFMPPCVIDSSYQAFTEGGMRMRPIQIPEGIFEEFLDIAEANTMANLETCGVLCGKQIPGQEALVMTTLIIPKQSATSDTCTTEKEEELFAEQIDRDLITLGWIHTHPTQTCFMSSLDLHTHLSYQLMLPEAIAIVCSPRHEPHFGIFRLTDPSGMDVIQNCKEKSAFHPHGSSKVIYTNADTGGHVVVYNYDFDIIDIRGTDVRIWRPISRLVALRYLHPLVVKKVQNMLFYSFFKTQVGQQVTVELKNDLAIKGTLESVDQFLNFKLKDIEVVDPERYPHMLSVKNCFIRGSVVRYVQLSPPTVDTALLQDATRREAQSTQQMQQGKPNAAATTAA
ncbi:hypothetical protein EV175_000709 [Coemansia sp. RSA 1933]|nr:hypothetical protein EV175_000709 [Coemansia sp. RSA 1933]